MKHTLLLIAIFFGWSACQAQVATTTQTASDSLMITIFLKHQQDKSLKQIQEIQNQNKFLEMFPPKEARVVSWYVMMGIGQVVTVKIPAKSLRTLNLSIENGAWGAYNTEFYPTYDFVPVWQNAIKSKK
ncbi:hypothetical protein [Spirosoma endophyticum]|uniref:Uncharacterized protein n=1 Tax=Spirosoma endophyticum TaxID=662367 RepID=A0A1I1LID0_9BACT|nr:hypothetical protein [Spirosoma endophyticum]SFC72725.1 hypothetical protein SAMN05216167_102247 [Spirosoma endophyticum]